MTPIDFAGSNRVYAADQPEYLPLPAHVDAAGISTTCWEFTWWERLKILVRGRVWLQQMTFNDPLQPQGASAERPELLK